MALDTTWWTTGYEDVELELDYSGASASYQTSGTTYTTTVSPVLNVCVPGGNYAGSGTAQHGDVIHGYYVFYNENGSKDYGRVDVATGLYRIGGYVPGGDAPTGDGVIDLFFPFSIDNGADLHRRLWFRVTTDSMVSRELHVWQPRCWYGTVAEVTGAILRSIGISVADLAGTVDTDSWSQADDNQTIEVFYRREPGQTYGQTIMALVRHSHDLLTITMGGVLALVSRDDPGDKAIASLDLTDGVIVAQWTKSLDHLCNYARVGYGRWAAAERGTYQSIMNVANPAGYQGADGWPWKEFEKTHSILWYGLRTLANTKAKTFDREEEESIAAYHLPYISDDSYPGMAAASRASVTAFMDRLDVDSKPRREIRVVQDMRGLDYDCGWKVEDVAVTHDGVTVAETRCTSKIIDFRDMTITSVLLEEPA